MEIRYFCFHMIDGLINCLSNLFVWSDDVEGLVSFHGEVELWVVEFLADCLHCLPRFLLHGELCLKKTHLDND
jgi:hypothetical protein